MDCQCSFLPPVSEWHGRCRIDTLFHSGTDTPLHVFRNGFTLCLGAGRKDSSQHFAGHHPGVDVVFLKEHADPQGFQLPDRFQALFRVSGEPGDGFDKDFINPTFTAIR